MVKKILNKVTEDGIILLKRAFRTDNVDPEAELNIDLSNSRYSISDLYAIEVLVNELKSEAEDELVYVNEMVNNELLKDWEITILNIAIPKELLDVSRVADGSVTESSLVVDLTGLEFQSSLSIVKVSYYKAECDENATCISIKDIAYTSMVGK